MPVRAPRRPRPSFVVTLSTTAAAALLVACGGQVEGDGGGPPIGPPVNPPFDGGPDPSKCPPTQPAIGTPCSGLGVCDYYKCGPGGPTGKTLHCEGGVFVEKTYSSCNPPPPACPPTRPELGSACSTYGFGCAYSDTCADRPSTSTGTDYLYCSGTWEISSSAPYVATCPKTEPRNGESCLCGVHNYGDCDYGYCGGYPTTRAKCDVATGKWSVSISTCNPPPPPFDAGPPEPAPDPDEPGGA